jgi:hypothetical protein
MLMPNKWLLLHVYRISCCVCSPQAATGVIAANRLRSVADGDDSDDDGDDTEPEEVWRYVHACRCLFFIADGLGSLTLHV